MVSSLRMKIWTMKFRGNMQEQKKYLTPEGHTIVATIYTTYVYWYNANKPTGRDGFFNRTNDHKETFFNRVARNNWKEVK